MARATRWAAAAALALAAMPARAWRRTEAVDASNHPIAGRCLWWAGKQVTFKVNASAASSAVLGCGSEAFTVAQVQQSLATWSTARLSGTAACTDFTFVAGGTSPSTSIGYVKGGANENLIVFRHGRCPTSGDPCVAAGDCPETLNCWEHDSATIALTTTSFDAKTGEILDADMELFDGNYAQAGAGYWFTCLDSTTPRCSTGPNSSCISMDLGSTATHEGGHMLGLGHTCDLNVPSTCTSVPSDATMFPSASVGQITKRTLKPDDVEGVCTIYPTGQPPQSGGGVGESGTACAALPPPEPNKSTGCSTAGGDAAGLLLAFAALARLRPGGVAARPRLRRR